MPEPTTPPETTEGELRLHLDTIRARMAAPGPTPEQLAAGDAEDRALVPRIHAARPGVPTHHIFATLQTLRALRDWEAAKESTSPVPGLREQIAAVFRLNNGQFPAWTKDADPDGYIRAVLAVVQPVIDEAQQELQALRDRLALWGDGVEAAGDLYRAERTRAETAEATIARVRKLHARTEERRAFDLSLHPIPTCTGCGERWPCPTTEALTPPSPADQTDN